MRILPLSMVDDNRTILQEVNRIRNYLEKNPIRNVFYIDENYSDTENSYDSSKIYTNLSLNVEIGVDDILLFKNGYIGIVDSIGSMYVTVVGCQRIKGEQGQRGQQGPKGDTGETGPQGPKGDDGYGVPSGGYTGQVLEKYGDGDGEVYWANKLAVPSNGNSGSVLKKTGDNPQDYAWGDIDRFDKNENLLFNPNFTVNQRGVSGISYSIGYKKDRWYQRNGAAIDWDTNSLSYTAKISQLIEFSKEKMLSNKKMVFGISYPKSCNVIPTLELYYSTSNIPSNFRNIVIAETTNVISGIKQVICEALIPDGCTYLRFIISHSDSTHTSDEISLYNAFMYYVERNFYAGNGVVVQNNNYIEELNKCKYYYEKITPNLPLSFASYTDSSYLYTTIILAYSEKYRDPVVDSFYIRQKTQNGFQDVYVNASLALVNKYCLKADLTQSANINSFGYILDKPLLTTQGIDAEIYEQ